ncbi:MAG: glycoside hydrolase family 5 protein [Ruminococcus sp.]|jgi:endoglucanase|nr:glycoside hydrolase family 5 protein [Ruminococcus sp.]
MKKIFSKLLTSILAIGILGACGTNVSGVTETTTAVTTTAATTSATTTTVTTAAPEEAYPFESAVDTAAKLGLGWNLGNAFDSVDSQKLGLDAESSWGNPKTTPELVKAVKDAGFDTIRIPVTYINHFDANGKIDEAWLKRVKEVVGYATDNDLYAIINIHHDGQQENGWLRPIFEGEEREKMVKTFETLWTQIANYFEDCGGNVLFAGMNEFHEGYSWTYPQDYDDITNRLNQAFVTTVRATGGNNAERILITPTYNTITAATPRYILPTDTIEGRQMLEVHCYDPWSFGGEGRGSWGSDADKAEVDNRVKTLKTGFVDKGVPVIMGEYGAVRSDNPERFDYIRYVTKAYYENGITPVWWDNGQFGKGTENFGLMDRTNATVFDKEALEAIMSAKE